MHCAALALYANVASRIMPGYANGHYELGDVLYKLGKHKAAISSYIKALQIKPDYAEAHYHLGNALTHRANYTDALAHYIEGYALAPDRMDSWRRLADALNKVSVQNYDRRLENLFFGLLGQETVGRPYQYVRPILGLLKLHPLIGEALQISAAGRIDESAPDICAKLSTIPLFLRAIELCPIPDFEVESLLTQLRRVLLLRSELVVDRSSILGFQASLALHCFTNEFVFNEDEDETAAVEALETSIHDQSASGVELDPFKIACLASYRPLYRYAWSHHLTGPESLKGLYKRQVKEVLEERSLRRNIPCLKPIEGQVSKIVREQYEENPYPRWVNTRLLTKPLTISALTKALELRPVDHSQKFSNRPDVLIAGCGSGQHSLGAASKYANSRVLAVDLSLSSLSHAIRKTRELGVSNITYMQADILDLGSLQRKFDVVESVGVLHHMADPIAGWKVLVHCCLKPGGLMKIGLYSEQAHRAVIEAEGIVSARGLSGRIEDIRKFRRLAFNQDGDSGLRQLVGNGHAFYSASACRDMYFHVQVHRFTIPQIKAALDALGLTFIGWEFSSDAKKLFERDHPDPLDAYSLDAWQTFETANPNTFAGMYQFWAQKNG